VAVVTQTSTSLGSVTSAANGTTTDVPAGTQDGRKNPVLLVVSTSVTSGATLKLQGRNNPAGISGTATEWRDLVPDFAVSANGSKAFPLAAYADTATVPDEVRIVGVAYTDGTHACSLLTHAG
jgi:hypothetical protein